MGRAVVGAAWVGGNIGVAWRWRGYCCRQAGWKWPAIFFGEDNRFRDGFDGAFLLGFKSGRWFEVDWVSGEACVLKSGLSACLRTTTHLLSKKPFVEVRLCTTNV